MESAIFWKSGDFLISLLGLRLQPRSIIRKLALYYALSAFFILLVASGFLYWVLVTNLKDEGNQFLDDKIRLLRLILKKHPNNPSFLEEEVKWEGASSRNSHYYAYYSRILDERGDVLIETPGMDQAIPKNVFPVSSKSSPNHLMHGVFWHLPDQKSYLLMSSWVRTGKGLSSRRLVQIALDWTAEETLIFNYRSRLAIVLAIGVLLLSGTGWVVSSHGMRPLREITRAAKSVTATDLHNRLDPAQWPGELKDLAEAFDQMLGRLENHIGQLSQFSADLAHELRTPIGNLMIEAEVTLSRARSIGEYKEVLESSMEEYARLSRMIDSLLFLARADSEQSSIEPALLDVRKELQAISDFYEAAVDEVGLKIRLDGNAVLNADPLLFRRAVSNLLSNALRHTPAGGEIILAVTGSDDGSVEVCVEDTGPGIGAEHLPRIFDRFYRADRARSGHSNSTGLGLSIVKSIMAIHGGSVEVRSVPDRGTAASLRFPCPKGLKESV